MKRLLLLPLALISTLVVVASAGADTKTVQITKAGFTPVSTTISVGDTVTWHNADSANHQVVANDGSFASPVLKPTESFSFTFQKAGKVNYHDALATTNKGSVTVNAPAGHVSLFAATQRVIYGSSTRLSGDVPNQLASETVNLTSEPFGKGTQSLATATTSSSGTFTFDVSPTIQTSYTAHWRTTTSNPVTINVAPRVGFGVLGRRYVAKVTSDLGYGGHWVLVQRRNALGGWHSVKRVFLGSSSRAVFRMRLPHGRSVLRLFLPESQAGAGYVSGLSHLVSVRR
jgi:plastocyanin